MFLNVHAKKGYCTCLVCVCVSKLRLHHLFLRLKHVMHGYLVGFSWLFNWASKKLRYDTYQHLQTPDVRPKHSFQYVSGQRSVSPNWLPYPPPAMQLRSHTCNYHCTLVQYDPEPSALFQGETQVPLSAPLWARNNLLLYSGDHWAPRSLHVLNLAPNRTNTEFLSWQSLMNTEFNMIPV